MKKLHLCVLPFSEVETASPLFGKLQHLGRAVNARHLETFLRHRHRECPFATGYVQDRLWLGIESGEHRAYLSPPWKLIWYNDERPSELFHLSNDPLELNDRANDEPQTATELEEKLIRWVERNLSAAPLSPDSLPPAPRGGLRGGQSQRTDPIYAVDGAWTCYIGRRGES